MDSDGCSATFLGKMEKLEKMNYPYSLITGPWAHRYKKAIFF
jgi:hypothetical protein